MLHCWGRIQAGQAVAGLDLVTVVGPWNHEIETILIKWHLPYLCGPGRGRGKQWLGQDTQSLRAASTYYYYYFYYHYSSLLLLPGGVSYDGEHELTHIEGVSPVVVSHTPVISPHWAKPSENEHLTLFANFWLLKVLPAQCKIINVKSIDEIKVCEHA